MLFAGFKIFYGDNTIQTSASRLWRNAKNDNVQVVNIYLSETYQIWKQDGYNEQGFVVNQRQETENYLLSLFSTRVGRYRMAADNTITVVEEKEGNADFYWFDRRNNELGAGTALEVPAGLNSRDLKTGLLLTSAQFAAIINVAQEDRRFP